MINPASLKGKINVIAKNKNLSPQEVLQMFFFERFLERLAYSKYKSNFIIKGGLLISSIIGMDNRTTMDMDTTVTGIPLKENIIKNVISEIVSIEVNDNIKFKIIDITDIREQDEYENFRIKLVAEFGKIKNIMKIDITTGDTIIPEEIEYSYPCMFNDKELNIFAYPIETILSEKFETIIQRNISTTRMRDFYDLYSLYHLKKDEINFDTLRNAVLSTMNKRNSSYLIEEINEIIDDIKEDNDLKELWNVYLEENPYVKNLSFSDTIKVIDMITEKINIFKRGWPKRSKF